MRSFVFEPIGVVRSPFLEKVDAPRQAVAARGALGTLEILPQYLHALDDLAGWERIWILFVFDRNVDAEGRAQWRSKVLPPRSDGVRRGLFSTRSPHRPNPIGMSAVRLRKVEGCTIHVEDLDLLEGTPILDLKPYVAYADAFPDAREGWLEAQDPRPAHAVAMSERALRELAWLDAHGLPLRAQIESVLALGPQPNAYRRIRPDPAGGLRLSLKAWRVRFHVAGDGALCVDSLHTGYRPSQLFSGDAGDPALLALHRAFYEAHEA